MSYKASDNPHSRASPRDLPELMDSECSYEDFRDCLRSLEQVNRWFFGYRPTLKWLKSLPAGTQGAIHIVDVGSGGGDLLRQIAVWAQKRGIPVRLTGIDLNPYAKRKAEESTPAGFNITWMTCNAFDYSPDKPIDVVVSSLLAHHLEDEELIEFLCWMEANAQLGWFINDLERSEWHSNMFAVVARLAAWHRFVQHDGPVSFRRAFRKRDWLRMLRSAGIALDAAIVDRWIPGRLCVGRWK